MPLNVKSLEPRLLGFFLVDGFALMSYASVVEPFRAANILSGKELYRWAHVSIDGERAQASNGAGIVADARVGDPIACDTLFIFAGGDPSRFDHSATLAWLRRLARANIRLAGISGGPYLLAKAGLLEGYRSTIHWEHRTALIEDFPTLAVDPGLYVIDRLRVTCAGGTAGLDLAVELIEHDHGSALAAQVSEWFIRTEARAADEPQRISLRERYGIANDRVLRVLASMERQVEDPLPRAQLARIAGVSVRQLERLFGATLRNSVNATYRMIRLKQAEDLLAKTGMRITQISVACGFQSVSHFSRAFKAQFGVSPRDMRRQA